MRFGAEPQCFQEGVLQAASIGEGRATGCVEVTAGMSTLFAAAGDTAPVTIVFPFMGGAVGGSHISAVKLIKGLDRREFRPLVVLHRCEGPTIALLEAEGIAYEPAPSPECFDPAAGGRIHQVTMAARLTRLQARFLRERGARIVHTNDGPMHATWAVAARGLRFLAPWLASRVVSVSKFASPPPGLISAAGRCSVVHSPFDTSIATSRPAANAPKGSMDSWVEVAQLGLPVGSRLLGFFGHLIDRKRPLQFVETIAAITARRPSMPVAGLMFGEALEPGLDIAVMERARQLGIADRIRLMGFRTPPEPWIEICDLMVVTAVDEPYGRTIIEAMLLGTPVVAAASGGNIEAIRHMETGVLAPPDRPEAFATAIIDLLDAPATAIAIAAAARTEALARYGIDGHVRSISDIYRQLAA